MTASVKMTAFSDMAPCSLIEADLRFRGVHCFHHQGNESSQYTYLNRQATSTRLHGATLQKAEIRLYEDIHVSGSVERPAARYCKHCNDSQAFVKQGTFYDQLINWQLFKKDVDMKLYNRG
jgi:hypothetical protein